MTKKKRSGFNISVIFVFSWRVAALIFLSASLAAPSLVAEDAVEFHATVDKETLALDDTLLLQLTITGGNLSGSAPALPPISGFKAYSSGQSENHSFINGKYSSRLVFSYSLVPQSTGTFTIPSLALNVGGQNLVSLPIKVNVVAASAASRTQRGAASVPSRATRDLFITTEVDKSKVFVGEALTLIFRFYSRAPMVSQPSYHPPETTGFLREDLPPQKQFMTKIEGKEYSVVELRTALFSTSPGEFTIGPASLECHVQDFSASPFSGSFFDSFFEDFFSGGKPVTLRSDPIHITVAPLPEEGRPRQFQGDVGRFEISATVDKRETRLHEPVTLNITVSGEGNIKSISNPKLPDLAGFRVYETLSSVNVDKANYRVRGSKVSKTILKPDVTGPLAVPPITFAFFDPASKSYRTVQTESIRLNVLPGDRPDAAQTPEIGSSGLQIVGKDIRFIKIRSALKPARPPFHRTRTFQLLNILPGAVFILLWALKKSRERSLTDPERAVKETYRKAEKFRKAAEAAVNKGDYPGCYENLQKALTAYMRGKSGVSASGSMWDELYSRLKSQGLPVELGRDVQELWDDLDMHRYAPSQLTAEKAKEHLRRLDSILTSVGGPWKTRPRSGSALLLLLALLPLAMLAEEPPQKIFEQANQAYREGSFSSAREGYESLAAKDIGGAEVYYNLGNTFYRLGEVGEARLWYERALSLSPNDEDTQHNIELIRSQIDESETSDRQWLEKLWPPLFGLTFCLNIFFFAVFSAGLYRDWEWLWWARWISGIGLIAFAGVVVVTSAQRSRVGAVVVQPRVEVRVGPGDEYQVGFVVPEGQKVVFFGTREGWNEIGVPDKGLKGWAQQDSVQKIAESG